MGSEIRIPTILGLGVLVFGLVIGMFLVSQNQSLFTKAAPSMIPKNITVLNLDSSSASIFWQTDQPSSGFIQAGIATNLDHTFTDERDLGQVGGKHLFHFVTLTDLKPQTTYHYRLFAGSSFYPQDTPLTVKTTEEIAPSSQKPLIGRLVDQVKKPVEEALIVLQLDKAQPIGTILKLSGNFILPLANLKTQTLDRLLDLESTVSAKLIITTPSSVNTVLLNLPFNSLSLPVLMVGQDLDLIPKAATTSSSIKATNGLIRFDLNKDGVINVLDYAIIVNNLGKNPKRKAADLNGDGIVDQKDLDLINQFLTTPRSR